MNAVMRLGWSKDMPPDGKIVEVWYINAIILAYHTLHGWHTAEGQAIDGVTHWRFRQ
jgi:hypothetical protein